jgi:hypothetical protein
VTSCDGAKDRQRHDWLDWKHCYYPADWNGLDVQLFYSDMILTNTLHKKMLEFCQKFLSILQKKPVRILSKNCQKFDENLSEFGQKSVRILLSKFCNKQIWQNLHKSSVDFFCNNVQKGPTKCRKPGKTWQKVTKKVQVSFCIPRRDVTKLQLIIRIWDKVISLPCLSVLNRFELKMLGSKFNQESGHQSYMEFVWPFEFFWLCGH